MRSWSWVNNWRYNREKSDIVCLKQSIFILDCWDTVNSSYGLTSRLLQLYWVSTDIAAFNRDSSPICFVCTEVCVETFTHSLPFVCCRGTPGTVKRAFENPKGGASLLATRERETAIHPDSAPSHRKRWVFLRQRGNDLYFPGGSNY